jgi:hypothetical protein
VVQAGALQAEVEVEPYVLPIGAGAEVGGVPTAAADAGVGAAVRVGRWSTTEWSSHILPLLGFLVGADCIVRDHDVAGEL